MMNNRKKIAITLILITSSFYYTPVATESNLPSGNQPRKLTRTIDYGTPESLTRSTTSNNSTAATDKKNENRRTGRRKAWWGKE